MTHAPLSLSFAFLDIIVARFWRHLQGEELTGQYVWTDDRMPLSLRGVVDSAAATNFYPMSTLRSVAELLEFESDEIFIAVDDVGWVERCASVPHLGEPGVVVRHGLASLIDAGVPGEFVGACVRGGLTDAGLVRAAWRAGVPAEYATS